ncbi:MAG: alanine--tRNA ligase [Candidatus Staskawiczbacteria bacterium]|nr:alanine--tRNA ligase [Candidatus Staskawiczbacteria bacterium]
MKSSELRQKFLQFFEKNGHAVIPSTSLIPDEVGLDQKTLFITAGMQPMVPYLMGKKHPEGKRIVDIQKCFRTVDIDEVGDDTHHTFFEMMGNWSLGDYWKKESIGWSFEFLTKELNIPLEKLAVSCFAGDENAPKDEESARIWESLGIPKERIAFLPKEDNWWGPVGAFGPCGPDTEIFYWKANDIPVTKGFDPQNKNWVEIWNNVFMEYVKDSNGNYVLAEQKNVDTGMGFERTLAILNGYTNNYGTDLFASIISKINENSNSDDEAGKRIIADHIRATVFMIADGIEPLNTGRGYLLRRLLRRVAYYCNSIELKNIFLSDLAEVVISIYDDVYALNESKKLILETIEKEVSLFNKTLEAGKKKCEEGEDPFILSTTYGFPIELTREIAKENGRTIDMQDFEQKMKQHQELSRTASAGMFKGGLADHEPATVKLHTAHHLLLSALQEVFGKEVKQRGSNINQERLRIDFSFDRKLTDEEKSHIEIMVNEKIQQGLDVVKREMPLEEAEKLGAEMEFGVKYGNMVSVYFIEDKKGNVVSKEFCGGPHVTNTSELGHFKILKEEASSQGVRRIKAILE